MPWTGDCSTEPSIIGDNKLLTHRPSMRSSSSSGASAPTGLSSNECRRFLLRPSFWQLCFGCYRVRVGAYAKRKLAPNMLTPPPPSPAPLAGFLLATNHINHINRRKTENRSMGSSGVTRERAEHKLTWRPGCFKFRGCVVFRVLWLVWRVERWVENGGRAFTPQKFQHYFCHLPPCSQYQPS